MALFWDLSALPHAYMESLKVEKAHLPMSLYGKSSRESNSVETPSRPEQTPHDNSVGSRTSGRG